MHKAPPSEGGDYGFEPRLEYFRDTRLAGFLVASANRQQNILIRRMISVCVSVCLCVCACACARAPSILPARRHTEAQKGNHRAAAVAVLLSGSQILGAEGAEAAPARRCRFHRRRRSRRHRRARGACFRLTVAAAPAATVSSAAAVTLLVAAPRRFAGETTDTRRRAPPAWMWGCF